MSAVRLFATQLNNSEIGSRLQLLEKGPERDACGYGDGLPVN